MAGLFLNEAHMSKIKVYIARKFNLFNPVDKVLITQSGVEVENSPWVQLQIASGNLLTDGEKPVKPVEPDEEIKTPKPAAKAVKK